MNSVQKENNKDELISALIAVSTISSGGAVGGLFALAVGIPFAIGLAIGFFIGLMIGMIVL